MTYLIVSTTHGRYYGSSIWTFDIQKAVRFPSKKSAKEVAKGYSNVKVIPLK